MKQSVCRFFYPIHPNIKQSKGELNYAEDHCYW